MEALGISLFLVTALVGSYVQSVTGFAMGMIMIAVTVGSGLVAVPVITAVVSLLSLINIVFALRGHLHHVERRMLLTIAFALPPAVWLGVVTLDLLDRRVAWLLELLLGGFIVLGSLSMMLRPRPRATLSRTWACLAAGFAGGLLGGLFSASGPVMGWFTYRQPLAVVQIRSTLLAVFALSTSLRVIVVGVSGGLTAEVWLLALLGLPLVLFGTWLGRAFAPPLSDVALKRAAFGILLLMGSTMVVRALWSQCGDCG
jgi:uncharacterized membrane protein YfcA